MPELSAPHRLLLLASALVFVDTVFFSVLAPLLPHYVSSLGLTEAQAGVLSGCYAIGTLVAALPAGVLVARTGPRTAVLFGLSTLGCSTAVFATSPGAWVIDAARFAQGVSGAVIFSGALVWIISATPMRNRGAAIGTATGAGVFGALSGPLLGGLAASIGVGVAFGAMIGVVGLLAVAAMSLPDAGEGNVSSWRDMANVLRRRTVATGGVLLLAPGICFGVLGVVAPLRIDSIGGGAGLIAGAYAASAVIEGSLSPFIGRRSDQVGRRRPYLAGVGICAAAVLCLAVAPSVETVLVAFLVSGVGAALCVVPGFAFVSDSAMAFSAHQGIAVGLANMAWSGGQAVGALSGGALAWSSGYAAPLLATFVLLLATLMFASRPTAYGWSSRV